MAKNQYNSSSSTSVRRIAKSMEAASKEKGRTGLGNQDTRRRLLKQAAKDANKEADRLELREAKERGKRDSQLTTEVRLNADSEAKDRRQTQQASRRAEARRQVRVKNNQSTDSNN